MDVAAVAAAVDRQAVFPCGIQGRNAGTEGAVVLNDDCPGFQLGKTTGTGPGSQPGRPESTGGHAGKLRTNEN